MIILKNEYSKLNIKNDALKLVIMNLKNNENSNYIISNGIKIKSQSYITHYELPEKYEYHKRYYDLFYIAYGEECEIIGDGVTDNLSYDKQNDIGIYLCKNYKKYTVKKEDIILIFPNEPHISCCATNKKSIVKKIIYKIPYDLIDETEIREAFEEKVYEH